MVDKNPQQTLQNRLHQAVKQCQIKYGTGMQLATDADSDVVELLSAWEAVFMHGLRQPGMLRNLVGDSSVLPGGQTLGAVSEQLSAGLSRLFSPEATAMVVVPSSTTYSDLDKCYWPVIETILTSDEKRRYQIMGQLRSDWGRARAWLRTTLNERSLQRSLHMMLTLPDLLQCRYEPTAFLLDSERAALLPDLAAGLHSILFALPVDRDELNAGMMDTEVATVAATDDTELQVESEPVSTATKKKKKPKVHVVSFDDEDNDQEYGSVTPAAVTRRVASRVHVPDPLAVPIAVPMPIELSKVTSQGRRTSSVTSCTSSNDDFSVNSDPSYYSVHEAFIPMRQGGDDGNIPSSSTDNLDDTTRVLSSEKVSEPQIVERTAAEGSESIVTTGLEATCSPSELREALLTLIARKSALERELKVAHTCTEEERAESCSLRVELASEREKHDREKQNSENVISQLRRENDLLKHQLKKYVSTVHSLQLQQKSDSPVEGSPTHSPSSAVEESESLQDKLCQLANMQAELLELNERLNRQLLLRETQIGRLRNQLELLRGPLPLDVGSEDVERKPDHPEPPLCNIWIPSAFLQRRDGSGSGGHHLYQVYCRICDEEWNVYRRYSDFLYLHNDLRRKYGQVDGFHFPPKRVIGNKGDKLVEWRRHRLQSYLRQVVNMFHSQSHLSLSNKDDLLALIPLLDPSSVSGVKPER